MFYQYLRRLACSKACCIICSCPWYPRAVKTNDALLLNLYNCLEVSGEMHLFRDCGDCGGICFGVCCGGVVVTPRYSKRTEQMFIIQLGVIAISEVSKRVAVMVVSFIYGHLLSI